MNIPFRSIRFANFMLFVPGIFFNKIQTINIIHNKYQLQHFSILMTRVRATNAWISIFNVCSFVQVDALRRCIRAIIVAVEKE